MIRTLIFLLFAAVAVLGAVWFADRPGTVTLNWQGWQIETSVGMLVLAAALLAGVIGDMETAVQAHGGMVAKRLGDGIMAAFGAPIALEDNAVCAGYAALMMLDTVLERARKIKTGHGVAEIGRAMAEHSPQLAFAHSS